MLKFFLMPHKRKLLAVGSFLFTIAAPQIHAQVAVKERIKSQATRILDGVDTSTVSESEHQRALTKLREAAAILDIDGITPPPGHQLFCEPRSSSYSYVTRASDGFRFGTDVTNETCQQIVARATTALVCGPRSSSYAHIYNIATGQQIGSDVSLDQCFDLINTGNRQLVCAPRSSSYSFVTRLNDNTQLGTDVSHEQCKEVIANATSTLVCAPRSSSYAYITRIATGERVGSDLSFEDCYVRIRGQ